MSQRRVFITIGKGGETSTLRTEGFTGNACRAKTAGLKAILGDIVEDVDTAEAHAAVTQEETLPE